MCILEWSHCWPVSLSGSTAGSSWTGSSTPPTTTPTTPPPSRTPSPSWAPTSTSTRSSRRPRWTWHRRRPTRPPGRPRGWRAGRLTTASTVCRTRRRMWSIGTTQCPWGRTRSTQAAASIALRPARRHLLNSTTISWPVTSPRTTTIVAASSGGFQNPRMMRGPRSGHGSPRLGQQTSGAHCATTPPGSRSTWPAT